MYNYCAVYKCNTLDSDIQRLFVEACEGRGEACVRHNLLGALRTAEDCLVEMHGVRVRLDTYNYNADHPLETGMANYAFIVADFSLGGKEARRLHDIVSSIGAHVETYAGTVFISRISSKLVDLIHRNEAEHDSGRYRLYCEKRIVPEEGAPFRQEVFKPRAKCSIC